MSDRDLGAGAPLVADAPKGARTVPLRVQVIDLPPFEVDLEVPDYLPARDLTRRVAIDANLGSEWPDRTRRRFWLRARGRVLEPDEKLKDLPISPFELIHLLAEPAPGDSVRERGATGAGVLPVSAASRVMRALALVAWAALWAGAMYASPGPAVSWWPALGAGALAAAVAHVPGKGAGLAFTLRLMALEALATAPALAVAVRVMPSSALAWALLALSAGVVTGGALGWLTWLGPVEPLALREVGPSSGEGAAEADHAACGLCAREVAADTARPCPYGCARTFHVGCLRARRAQATGDGCEVCGARVRRLTE